MLWNRLVWGHDGDCCRYRSDGLESPRTVAVARRDIWRAQNCARQIGPRRDDHGPAARDRPAPFSPAPVVRATGRRSAGRQSARSNVEKTVSPRSPGTLGLESGLVGLSLEPEPPRVGVVARDALGDVLGGLDDHALDARLEERQAVPERAEPAAHH